MATIIDSTAIKGKDISESGAAGLTQKVLFGREPGRKLNCNIGSNSPGGKSKVHSHDWEQINYVLAGSGLFHNEKEPGIPIKAGFAIHVSSNEVHWFENTGHEPLVIIGVLGPMPE